MAAKMLETNTTTKKKMVGRFFKIKKQNCYLKTGVNTHTPEPQCSQ